MRKIARKISNGLKTQDNFGEAFHMKLDNGANDLKSIMGSLCSLIVLLFVVAYAGQKMEILLNKKDVDVLSTVNDSHFDPDYIFDYD